MILSVPSFRQCGELHDMPVQVDPLNNFQSRVMQKPLQIIPHRASAPRFAGNMITINTDQKLNVVWT